MEIGWDTQKPFPQNIQPDNPSRDEIQNGRHRKCNMLANCLIIVTGQHVIPLFLTFSGVDDPLLALFEPKKGQAHLIKIEVILTGNRLVYLNNVLKPPTNGSYGPACWLNCIPQLGWDTGKTSQNFQVVTPSDTRYDWAA